MTNAIQPFHLLVTGLAGWLKRYCDVKSSILLL